MFSCLIAVIYYGNGKFKGGILMSINKDCSNLQEREVAMFLNGNTVAGSGCGQFNAGDVSDTKFLFECKTVTKSQTSFSIKKDWVTKIEEQSFEQGFAHSGLVFRFEPQGKDFVVLDIATFKLLRDYAYSSDNLEEVE